MSDPSHLPDVPPARTVRQGIKGLIPTFPWARRVQQMPMAMSRIRAFIELLLLIPAGYVGDKVFYIAFRNWPMEDERRLNFARSIGTGLAMLLVCLLILFIAGHKPKTIGWTRRQLSANVGIGLAALVVTYAALFMVGAFLVFFRPELLSEPPTAQKAIESTFPPASAVQIILIMLFIAFWEEVVFRGFVLTRLCALLKRWWLAIVIASPIFGIGHYYEGPLAITIVTTLALVMSILFVWRKSLVPSIAFHTVHNIVIFSLIRSVSTTWR